MNPPVDPNAQAAVDAEARLARLGVQIDAMQAVLVRLLQDVVRAEHRLDQNQAAQLVAVNEQLVVAALASQAEVEASAQALREATQSAGLDALTGLPNRATLHDHFEQAAALARRHHARFALLFIDLDRFKPLNDTYGHAFGDRVLRHVAERLVAAVRAVDTVSRHGGDEFVVLLAEMGHADDATVVADKLTAAIAAPVDIDGHEVRLTASAGVAVFPDDGDTFDALLSRADATMYATKREHARALGRPDGGARDPRAHAAPDSTAAPAPTADVDERLAQLREANEKLVIAVLGAQELQAAAEQARERQTAFLAAVAEELRNPLAPIRIATAMLGRPPEDEPLLPRVKNIVEHQLGQISRLVDAVSVESGGLQIERHRVDLAAAVDRAVAALRPAIDSRGQHLNWPRPAGPLAVTGDAPRLELVVSNLLDNASRYTHDGGHIDVTLDVDADLLTLTVSDDGIGIEPSLLPLIFDPFVQDPRALAFSGMGLGIGLTVARALVRAHGGHITAHSDGPSRGSRFVVTLPRVVASAPAAGDAGTAS